MSTRFNTSITADCNHWEDDIKRSLPDVILMDIEMSELGYILKNEPPQKYLRAINKVYKAGAPISPAAAKQ